MMTTGMAPIIELDSKNDPLEFPSEVISGAAGEFANLYSQYLEVPRHFFFMSFLTCLGSLVADQLTLASELDPQPRLYTLLLGESGDDRKSTAISKTVNFFQETSAGFPVCWGVGSAEGLQKKLERGKKLVLCLDEFKQFISKCKIDSSVLLPCVNTLFESPRVCWRLHHLRGWGHEQTDTVSEGST